MAKIGIGESDFKALRLKNNYYIDKTLYIKDIIDNQSKVILVTRPRRFGKTLNMSTLRYFFDCEKKDTLKLFNGLKIMAQNESYTSKLGAYPCIYMTLKDVKGSNFEEMLLCFQTELNELFIEHANLLNSDKLFYVEKEMYNTILNFKANTIQLQGAIKLLSRILYRVYSTPVMVFLDEYDVPLQNAYVHGFYDEAIDFFRTFYGTTFKDNSYLEKTIITGVSRVAKESIFSGANNFNVYTVLDNEFADDFGITKPEMDKIINDFHIQDSKENLKEW